MPGWRSPKVRKKQAQVRFTEKLGQRILDLASENPSPTAIARMIDCGVKTIWWWIYCSSEEQKAHEAGQLERDPKFLVRWPTEDSDAEPRWFHELFKLSQKMAGLTMDLENRSEVMFGTRRAVRDPKTNRQIFEIDEAAIRTVGAGDPFSDEARRVAADLYDIPDFPYAHDAAGKRIPVIERVPVAAQTRIHTLRSVVPQVYDIADRTEHSGTQSHVLIIGGNKRIERAPSPLRNDLEQRLQAIRARGPENPKPENPLAVAYQRGASAADPPERLTVDGSPPAEPKPPADLTKHPRMYQAPAAPKPTPSYARPEQGRPAEPVDRGGVGYGPPPPGGYRVA